MRVTQRVEKKRFGRERVVPEIEELKGWRLGAISWQLNPGNVRIEEWETCLLDREDGVKLVRVKHGPHGWEPLDPFYARREEVGNGYYPESAARAIESLVERHASPADP